MSEVEQYDARKLLIELMGEDSANSLITWLREIKLEGKHEGKTRFLYGPPGSGKSVIMHLLYTSMKEYELPPEELAKANEPYPGLVIERGPRVVMFFHDIPEDMALRYTVYKKNGMYWDVPSKGESSKGKKSKSKTSKGKTRKDEIRKDEIRKDEISESEKRKEEMFGSNLTMIYGPVSDPFVIKNSFTTLKTLDFDEEKKQNFDLYNYVSSLQALIYSKDEPK